MLCIKDEQYDASQNLQKQIDDLQKRLDRAILACHYVMFNESIADADLVISELENSRRIDELLKEKF